VSTLIAVSNSTEMGFFQMDMGGIFQE